MATYKIISSFKKGEVYDTSDANISKEVYAQYFENEELEDHDYERSAADICKKSFKMTITITEK